MEAGKGEERPWQVDREGNREREREKESFSVALKPSKLHSKALAHFYDKFLAN